MKKILFAALAVLTLGMFSSCVYDNPIDDGSGKKLVTSGAGSSPLPKELDVPSLFNPKFNAPIDFEIWTVGGEWGDYSQPTLDAGAIGIGKVQIKHTWYGCRVGGYNNLAGVEYDLSSIASVSFSMYIPNDLDGDMYFIWGKPNDAYKIEYKKEVLKEGAYNFTIGSDEINADSNSPCLFTVGGSAVQTGKSLYIFNITFYDEDGNEITEIPVSGLDSDDDEEDDDE